MSILITRPGNRGRQLASQLLDLGFNSIHTPLFKIIKGREVDILDREIQTLNPNDYIFISSHYATKYIPPKKNQQSIWPAYIQYYSVGKNTAKYFTELTERTVHYPLQENSEGVLSLKSMLTSHLSNKKIIILRGNSGREILPETLENLGASVKIIETYQRIKINYDNEKQTNAWLTHKINTIIVTSSEILKYLIDFVPKKNHNWLLNCHLIVASHRLAKQANTYGWKNVTLAISADNNSLCDTLLSNVKNQI